VDRENTHLLFDGEEVFLGIDASLRAEASQNRPRAGQHLTNQRNAKNRGGIECARRTF